ncbi:MAG: PAS domain-containing protein, partial [Ktedonobacterales bacterium]|nr:PAS domain-containing protein [Ktedonobacterales bacterium]
AKSRAKPAFGAELAILAEIFEQAPSFMAVLSGPTFVFEMVNKAYYQLVGHRDVLGKTVLVALPEVAGQQFIELLTGVYQTGVPFIGKELLLQMQFTPEAPLVDRFVDFVYQARRNADGEITGIFAHGVDVTDLVQARRKSEAQAEQLRQQAQVLDAVLTNIPDFIYTFDRSGRFSYTNKPLLDLLGLTLDDVIGKNFFELPYPHDLATTLQTQVSQVIRTGKQVHDETLYTSPGGLAGYYEYIFSPVFDSAGEVLMVAGATRNITERVRRAQQKDEFLGVVSHELKTPVTSLKVFAQVLQRRLTREGNTATAEQLLKMDNQINKLVILINDLLDVTRISSGKMQFRETDFAFDAVVAEAIDEVQQTTEGHRITHSGASNHSIHGDRDRIGQVLINLLINAIKFSPDAKEVVVTTTADATSVTLSVRDFGIGISAEQLPHLFERYYQGAAEHDATLPGLGLGLYISADIIKRHGGTLAVESQLGHGTTFSFTLPVVSNATDGAPALTHSLNPAVD